MELIEFSIGRAESYAIFSDRAGLAPLDLTAIKEDMTEDEAEVLDQINEMHSSIGSGSIYPQTAKRAVRHAFGVTTIRYEWKYR